MQGGPATCPLSGCLRNTFLLRPKPVLAHFFAVQDSFFCLPSSLSLVGVAAERLVKTTVTSVVSLCLFLFVVCIVLFSFVWLVWFDLFVVCFFVCCLFVCLFVCLFACLLACLKVNIVFFFSFSSSIRFSFSSQAEECGKSGDRVIPVT